MTKAQAIYKKQQERKHWWIVMAGIPEHTGITRATARKKIKGYSPKNNAPTFLYVGKVMPNLKRRGHGTIILEY